MKKILLNVGIAGLFVGISAWIVAQSPNFPVLQGYYPTGKKYVPFQVDSTGKLKISGGGGGGGCTPSGSKGVIQASDGSGGCQATAVTDNGTNVTSTEPLRAPSYTGTGSNPFINFPSNTTHTGAAGDLWNNSGILNFGVTPLQIVTGPSSATSGHVATFNGTSGASIQDGGALPTVTGGTCPSNQFVNAISSSAVPTCAAPFTLTTTGTSGAATFSGGTLNIPNYTVGGSGLTINSTTISGGATNAILYGDGTLLQNEAGVTRTGAGQFTFTKTGLGTTNADSIEVVNTTAAAAGAQQISPSIHWGGQGWKTTATAASQAVDFISYVLPVQGTTSPTAYLQFAASTNGSAFGNLVAVGPGGQSSEFVDANQGLPNFSRWSMGQGGFYASNATGYNITSSTAASGGTVDSALCRAAAGILEFSTTDCQTGKNSNASIRTATVQSTGTKFTTSGCSVSSTTGGAAAGKLTLGANTCTVTITINGATGLTATNGWSCWANDETAPLILITASAPNATTATLSIPATAGTTDVINFGCQGF